MRRCWLMKIRNCRGYGNIPVHPIHHLLFARFAVGMTLVSDSCLANELL